MGDKKNDINFSNKAIETITALSKKLAANREANKKTTKKKTKPKTSGVRISGMGQLGKFNKSSKSTRTA
jgi:hypothetical protein